MKREKILFVARNYPPNIGGLETLNQELYLQLKKKVSIELVKNTGHRYSIKFLVSGLFKVIFSDCKVILLSDALLSLYIPFIKILGKKVLIRVNGLDITGPNFFYQLIIPFLTNLSDRVICISNATKDECVKRRIDPKKITIIPPGVNSNSSFINKKSYDKETFRKIFKKWNINIINKTILLTVGRLIERKGQYWFIKNVIPKLSKNIIYLVIGEGPDKERIISLITHKKLSDQVYLLGKIFDKIKWLIMNNSDLFILPNIPIENDIEGFGITALEASSCGLPVIASNLEGLKDAIINGKNGFLVEPYDVNEFLRVINKLLADDEKRKKFGEEIRRFTLENYSWKKISESYLKEFISLFYYENKKE